VDTTLLLALCAVVVAIGVAGIFVPALPGVPLILAGLVGAAWVEGFQYVGAGTLILIGVLAALAWVTDFAAGALGARKYGASRQAVVGAMIGAIAGIFLGIPGLILGPFVGAAAGEWIARRDLRQAGRAGFGTWLGMVVGAACKLALSISMIGVYLAARLI
jgi:uncharacterized protein YqgC (DUF456 family)